MRIYHIAQGKDVDFLIQLKVKLKPFSYSSMLRGGLSHTAQGKRIILCLAKSAAEVSCITLINVACQQLLKAWLVGDYSP